MSNSDHIRTVLRCAAGSRILLLTLIILWRSMFSPYDTSASINPSCLSPSSNSPNPEIVFPSIASAIEESIVWDSVYFVRIAQCGLSVLILKDSKASLRATILFCFNPASIFYSSIYTESLYALFSIGGLYYLMCGANNFPVVWLAISGSARSNGVLNAGYYGFKAIHQSYHALYVKKRACLVLQALVAGALRCICIFIPFLVFQAYGYYNICHGRNPDEMRPWCKKRIPLLYSFIQSHYWNVGFLRYFQLKQLPNFLLASPVLSFAFCAIYSYSIVESENFFSLGFGATRKEKSSAAVLFNGGEGLIREDQNTGNQENTNLRRRKKIKTLDNSMWNSAETVVPLNKSGYYSAIMLPFIYHLGFMAATAFFVMHVQVATRFLSASPPLYWYASYVMASPEKSRRWAYLMWAYAASYILLGSLLFSTFYPFT